MENKNEILTEKEKKLFEELYNNAKEFGKIYDEVKKKKRSIEEDNENLPKVRKG